MNISLIVTAAGSSRRFFKSIPSDQKSSFKNCRSKCLVSLAGKPVIQHSLESFLKCPGVKEIFVTCGVEDKNDFKKVLSRLSDKREISLVSGGKTRAESVEKALKKCSHPWVMVHDGARPLFHSDILSQLIHDAETGDGAIIARPVVPTLKRVSGKLKLIDSTVDRSGLFEAETPQLVRKKFLLKGYSEVKSSKHLTDEAGLMEMGGAAVAVTAIDAPNPKITVYNDLKLAEFYLTGGESLESRQYCTGIGYDIHRLVPERKLWIGGVLVPSPKGSLGHSDGDVLLHAIVDAMLGALGMGDIGDLFPDTDKKNKNRKSSVFVKEALKRISIEGWHVSGLDANVILENPKLGRYKEKIKKNVASLLRVSSSLVSIKAKTNEKLGPEGRGEALSAQVLVTLQKS